MNNTFGRIFRLTTFGESHGPAIGGVVDGCPAGLALTTQDIQRELDLRRPGNGQPGSTPRKEADQIHLLSGIFEGLTTGTPIGFSIANTNQHPSAYDHLRDIYRPGHADYTLESKYGLRDYLGGGRSSGRETACRVAGGAIAQKFLEHFGINVMACTQEIGGISAETRDISGAASRIFFAPNADIIPAWEKLSAKTKAAGDTLGGLVRLEAHGLPAGLGEPVFDKLDARIGAAMFSVGAVKGVEIGAGFNAARALGSENNDPLLPAVATEQDLLKNIPRAKFGSNNAGGILGGISTGQPLVVTVAVKPIPSIGKPQQTITRQGKSTTLEIGGRHDICAIPRIVPVLKAMLALTLADFLLLQRVSRIS